MKDDRAEVIVAESVAELRSRIGAWRAEGHSIGFVPTMGALHDGHLALIRAARADCDRVAVSIFVNPLQFDRPGDLETYPRTLDSDMEKLRAESVDLLFLPSASEMYPEGFATGVMVAGVSEGLCGAHRPGHFGGVATVVAKLLLQALPDRAYFGEKDYQQLLVIKRMVTDLDIPVEIVPVATIRETDGLALSSRNQNLSARQRAAAPALNRVMREVAEALAEGAPAEPLLEEGREALSRAGFERVEYLELRDGEDLTPVTRVDRPCRLLAAAWLGNTRLIDNLPVEPAA